MAIETVAGMACTKSLLMIFNLAFWASGLAILFAGVWMQVELHKYLELSADFSNTAPYVLVGTGALILIIGTLACCCTLKGQPALLYLYGGFLGLILIVEVTLAFSIYTYKDHLSDGFDRGLNQSMISYGPTSNTKTDAFDWMQTNLHCCGSHGYEDWNKLNPQIPVPASCCRQPKCDVQDDEQIYTEGCFGKVVEFLDKNMGMIAGAALGFALFPMLGVVLACSLATNLNRAQYEQMA